MMEAAMTVSQLGKDLSSCLHSSCMTRPHSPGPAAAGSTSHDSLSKSSLPLLFPLCLYLGPSWLPQLGAGLGFGVCKRLSGLRNQPQGTEGDF